MTASKLLTIFYEGFDLFVKRLYERTTTDYGGSNPWFKCIATLHSYFTLLTVCSAGAQRRGALIAPPMQQLKNFDMTISRALLPTLRHASTKLNAQNVYKSLALSVYFKVPELNMKKHEILSRASAFLLAVDPEEETPGDVSDIHDNYRHMLDSKRRFQTDELKTPEERGYLRRPAGE